MKASATACGFATIAPRSAIQDISSGTRLAISLGINCKISNRWVAMISRERSEPAKSDTTASQISRAIRIECRRGSRSALMLISCSTRAYLRRLAHRVTNETTLTPRLSWSVTICRIGPYSIMSIVICRSAWMLCRSRCTFI